MRRGAHTGATGAKRDKTSCPKEEDGHGFPWVLRGLLLPGIEGLKRSLKPATGHAARGFAFHPLRHPLQDLDLEDQRLTGVTQDSREPRNVELQVGIVTRRENELPLLALAGVV